MKLCGRGRGAGKSRGQHDVTTTYCTGTGAINRRSSSPDGLGFGRNSPGVRAGLQEEGHVAGREVQGRHADDEPYEAADDGPGDVPELVTSGAGGTASVTESRRVTARSDRITHLLLRPVGVPRVDQRNDAREGPGGRGHQQRDDVAETERPRERRLQTNKHTHTTATR